MADKEIGLFQVRTGKQRNLPTALEHAELTLTTDECRMFVGLPAVVTPASLVASRRKTPGASNTFLVQGSGEENVEIITEFTPQHVLNRLLNQHTTVQIPPTITPDLGTQIQIPYVSRLIINYVAYNISGTVLESGNATALSVNEGDIMLTQQNNTNHPTLEPLIEITEVLVSTGFMTFRVSNSALEDYVFEFSYQGWNDL